MIIGVPRESHHQEHRVGITPTGVARLIEQGHQVVIEKGAGQGAHFADEDYQRAGARVVYEPVEVYQRADLVSRVGTLSEGDLDLLKPGLVVVSSHHLAVAPVQTVERLMALETTLVGYEVIRAADGTLPVLFPLSEIAGQMAVQLAAQWLQSAQGGRGILLGNVPGVPPPTVLIIGAGSVGRAAARQALATGAHVIAVDSELAPLRQLSRELGPQVVTAISDTSRLARLTAIADVVIGAVLVPGHRAPHVIDQSMVERMKAGSVIIDLAIDQGGCIATSRPTNLEHPTYIAHGVVHYCVPNLTANVARTATRVLSIAALPYVQALANHGLPLALRRDPGLARGVYLYRGKLVNADVAAALGLEASDLESLLDHDLPADDGQEESRR